MYKTTFILVMFALAGCVSTKNVPLSSDAIPQLQGKSLGTVSREKPDFAANTAGKAMFGVLGAVAVINAGNKIIEENNVDDPADYISESLSTALSAKLNGKVVPANGTIAQSEESADLAKQYQYSDLLLDIRTINWSFIYFPTEWDKYRVIYSAKLRLIDTKTAKVLAEGFCARVPEESDTAPSYDLLLADKAARLKAELRSSADYCIDYFKENTLPI